MNPNLRAFETAPVPLWERLGLLALYGGVKLLVAFGLLYWLAVPAEAGEVQDAQWRADTLDFIMGDHPSPLTIPTPPRKRYKTESVNRAYDAYGASNYIEITIVVRPRGAPKESRPVGRSYRQFQRDKYYSTH